MRALSLKKSSSVFLVLALIVWVPQLSAQVNLAPLGTNPDSAASLGSGGAPPGTPIQAKLTSQTGNGSFLDLTGQPPQPTQSAPQPVLGKLGDSSPIFIENKGQFDSRVKFQVRSGNKTLWLTSQGIVFDVVRSHPKTWDFLTIGANVEDHSDPGLGRGRGWASAGCGAILAFLVFMGIPASRRSWRSMLGMLVVMAVLVSMAGCGSPGGSSPPQRNPGTTAGTYTFTVTGAGSASVTPNPTTTFDLTVN